MCPWILSCSGRWHIGDCWYRILEEWNMMDSKLCLLCDGRDYLSDFYLECRESMVWEIRTCLGDVRCSDVSRLDILSSAFVRQFAQFFYSIASLFWVFGSLGGGGAWKNLLSCLGDFFISNYHACSWADGSVPRSGACSGVDWLYSLF